MSANQRADKGLLNMKLTLDQIKQKPPVFAGVALTAESIQAARQFYVDLDQRSIAKAISGELRVKDLESYIEWKQESIARSTGENVEVSFTLLQKAHTIQTGECVALLP